MFGEDVVSQGGKIVRLQRSAWVSDSWSMGAGTYPRVGSNPAMWDIFSEPMCPGVYFAGEHTSFVNHGTVHGAYLSGLRAASQVMEDLCEQKRLEEVERERQRKQAKEAKQNEGSSTDKKAGNSMGKEDSKDEL
ncbi:lysine-specific histone demethylase-like protein 2 [Elysia marginata]|uniref:Lysine-specific histone demethylase-like protein 2 n=1 Tax=Elysia marginata TaxID=1093978 RepID=A0AAV4FXA3_9GAST|nr:lysine-specific histone demethylase-like protein 2 [Elysia marginata]